MSWSRDDAKLDRVRALMAEDGLDALVVRAPDNVLYLTNFWPMKGYDACVFPREGESVLICLEASAEDAERTFRLALFLWQSGSEEERLDPYYAAQAQYYLGEVYAGWFRALPLDPAKGDEALLGKQLEDKAEMLLSAQGHYLRAIRLGNDTWAVASGFRIGELYDGLRAQLIDAPLPPGLSGEEADAYRKELRRKLRVLATKAITAYEQTLQRASRSGVDDLRFLADAQASLERLRRMLAEDAVEGAM